MDPRAASEAAGPAISLLGTAWMTDMATYLRGGELGYQGVDFYVAGRGGALGDVDADVVSASFVFFEPTTVRAAWDRTAELLPRLEVAQEFAAVLHRWAEDKVPDDVDAERIAELTGRLVADASPAAAPLFAGWRALPEPDASRPKALAMHRLNALRELRGALHGAAVLTQGITPHEAVARRTPYMLEIFGWSEPHPEKEDVREPWDRAQAATEVAFAPVFEALDPAERAEVVELAVGLQAAVSGS